MLYNFYNLFNVSFEDMTVNDKAAKSTFILEVETSKR